MRKTPSLVTPAFRAIAFAAFAYFVAGGMILPVLSRYVVGPLNGSKASVGLVAGAFSLSAVVLRPYAGRLADTRGRRILIVGGALLAGIAVAGYSAAESVSAMIFLRLVNGTGEAFFFTGALTAIHDLAPTDRRGEAVSFFTVALYSGLALGPVLGEWILVHGSFEAVWWISGILAVITAGVALRIPETRPGPPPQPPTQEPTDSPRRSNRFVHPGGIVPGIVLAASIWGFTGLSFFGPLYALDIGLSGSRLVFAVYSGTILAIRGLGAKVPDRVGFRKTATISLFISVAGLVLIGATGNAVGLYAGVAVFAVGQGLAFPSLVSLVAQRVPAGERGAAIATFTAFLDVAFGVGPLTLGLVAQAFGLRAVFGASALVAAAGAALLASARQDRLSALPPQGALQSSDDTV